MPLIHYLLSFEAVIVLIVNDLVSSVRLKAHQDFVLVAISVFDLLFFARIWSRGIVRAIWSIPIWVIVPAHADSEVWSHDNRRCRANYYHGSVRRRYTNYRTLGEC